MGGTTTKTNTVNKPNTLGDFKLQSTSYGKTIPKVYGQHRIEGNVTALDSLRVATKVDVETTEIDEGKGGYIDTTRDYTYIFSASLELSLAEILTGPKNIGWVWTQNRKSRFANSALRSSFEVQNNLYKIALDYEMGTKPQLPNFSFEINGSTGGEEWQLIESRNGEEMQNNTLSPGKATYGDANDDWMGTASYTWNNDAVNIRAYKLEPIIDGQGGVEKVLDTYFWLPDDIWDEYVYYPPAVSIKDEFLYVAVNGSRVSNKWYGHIYTLCYNLKTGESQVLTDILYTPIDLKSWTNLCITADSSYLFVATSSSLYGTVQVAVYNILNGFPEFIEVKNFNSIYGVSLSITNNDGKLYMIGNRERPASTYLYEYYYPTDTILEIPDFLQAEDYPDDKVEVLDFVNDGEDLGFLINFSRTITSGETQDPPTGLPFPPFQDYKAPSVGIAYRRAGGSVEYYTLEESQVYSARGGALTIKNGYIAAYVNPTLLGTVFTELVLSLENILYSASTDVYTTSQDIISNDGAFAMISEYFKAAYYVVDNDADSKWYLSQQKWYVRPQTINDVNVADIIQHFLLTSGGLNLSNDVNINVSDLRDYCSENGLQVSLALTERRSAFDIVKELMTAANAVVRQDTNFGLEFLPYQQYTTPLATIKDSNLIGSVSDVRKNIEETPTAVRLEFANRDIEYNSDVWLERNEVVSDLDNIVDLNMRSVTRNDVAAKVSKLYIQRNGSVRHGFAFNVPITYMSLLPGQYLKINSEREEIYNQKVYILEIIENETTCTLICEEYVEDINSVSEVPTYESEAERVDVNVSPGKGILKLFKVSLNGVYFAVGGSTYWKDSRVFVSYDKGQNYSLLDYVPYNNYIGKVVEYSYPNLKISPVTANVPAQAGEIVTNQGRFAYSSYSIALDGRYTFVLTEEPPKKIAPHSYVSVFTSGGNSPGWFSIPDEYVNSTLYFKVEGRNIYNSPYQNSANMPATVLGGQA